MLRNRVAQNDKVIAQGGARPNPWQKPISWPRLAAVTVGALAVAIIGHYGLGSEWGEAAAVATGLIAVYLCAVEHISNWPVSIVSVIITGAVLYQANLKADATLQVVFLILSFHGWVSWARSGVDRSALKISTLRPWHWILVVCGLIAGTALYKPLIDHWKGDQALLDTFLFVASVITQVLQNRKLI